MISFRVHSRQSISSIVIKDTPYAVISICCDKDEFANLNLHENHPNCIDIMRLKFDDITNKDEDCLIREGKQYKLFSREIAEEILSFFYSVKDKVKIILINCDAGNISEVLQEFLYKLNNKIDLMINYENSNYMLNILTDTYLSSKNK